ncbi:MAG: hypothetical protein M3Y59_01275 [Myxococcota bacterium]|nr:hypothetical protein [Myxococcota bacterium]
MPLAPRPLALLLSLASFAALAQPAPPRDPRLLLNTFTVVRLNPLGADLQATVSYVTPIGDSDDRMWRTRFWSLGAKATVNPAEASVQGIFEYEPLAMFQLKAVAEYRGYFGGFNELLSFPTLDPEYSDTAIRAAAAAGQNYATTRYNLRVEPKLRAAFGPIGLQNTFSFIYGVNQVRPGDQVFYEASMDMLRPANGVTLVNSFNAVYLAGPMTAGLVHEWAIPIGLNPEDQIHRVGSVFSWRFYEDTAAWVNKPTVFALVMFNVQHRGRAGPIPTVVVGFASETDLWAQR